MDVENALRSVPALHAMLVPEVFAHVYVGAWEGSAEWKDSEFGADNVHALGKEQVDEVSYEMFCDWDASQHAHSDSGSYSPEISPLMVSVPRGGLPLPWLQA